MITYLLHTVHGIMFWWILYSGFLIWKGLKFGFQDLDITFPTYLILLLNYLIVFERKMRDHPKIKLSTDVW